MAQDPTIEDPEWTKRYHEPDPSKQAFGGRVEITMNDGSMIVDELAVADAHSAGAKPFKRANYVRKFTTLTEGIISAAESKRFLDLVQRLPDAASRPRSRRSTSCVDASELKNAKRDSRGIF